MDTHSCHDDGQLFLHERLRDYIYFIYIYFMVNVYNFIIHHYFTADIFQPIGFENLAEQLLLLLFFEILDFISGRKKQVCEALLILN